MSGSTCWIWLKNWSAEDRNEPVLVLFRKVLEVAGDLKRASFCISADSRYKLYINGKLAEIGPSRGDGQVWFYDEVDVLPYLKKGKNAIAVQVLRYPRIHRKGNHGIFRTEVPGLYLKGKLTFADGCGEEREEELCADASWRARKDGGFAIVSESEIFAPLQIYEERHPSGELKGWMREDYDDSGWEDAFAYPYLSEAVSPGNLYPRTIPFLYRKDRKFQDIVTLRETATSRQAWEGLIRQGEPLVIPAYSREIVEITAGEEMTGYLHLALYGGKGTDIRILQSESYVTDERKGDLPVKGRRDDWENGHLEGFCDLYHAAGYGTEEIPEEYEPFWFRTFRFIRLEITTAEEPVAVARFDYTETGYPLEVRTSIQTSDPELEAIWEMSERTLRRCMHETYEDCPFYEQLQYAMDSRAQILYTYAVAADDRLARKCMDDFRRSQRYDGLINCSYPNYGPNVIPGFSIYYILMLHDHMMYFGDREMLEQFMPSVEGILNFFHRHRENGLVQKVGGLNGGRFWSFIDWTPEWDETTGVPPATLSGPITMESLLYIMGLQAAADIFSYLGEAERAAMYRERAEGVKAAVRESCTGEDGMLRDGPGIDQYSQHPQVFAVLTDTLDREDAKKNLEKTLRSPEKYAQCSVAMAYYLFRALEKAGLYEWSTQYWNIWKRMLAKGATTCVEDEVGERSECHAWGALMLYELPSVILGVRPAKPGYGAVSVNPHGEVLEWFKGEVIIPRGMVHVEKCPGGPGEEGADTGTITVDVPEGLEIV